MWPKGERGLEKKESEVILHKTGSFVQVGSGKFYFSLCGFINNYPGKSRGISPNSPTRP